MSPNASALMRRLDQDFSLRFGHKLFTITALHPDGNHVIRLYSSQQGAYAQDGLKPVTRDGWHAHVIEQGKVFRGSVIEDVKDYFPDHEKIAAMGLGAVLNIPVKQSDLVVGTVNILDADHAYDHLDLSLPYEEAQRLAIVFAEYRADMTEAEQ